MTANPVPKTDEFDLSTAQVLYPFGAPMDPATAEPVEYEPPPGALLPGEKKPRAKPGPKKGSKRKAGSTKKAQERGEKNGSAALNQGRPDPLPESPAPAQPLLQRIAPASGLKDPANRVWFFIGAFAVVVIALCVAGAFRVLTGAW